MAGKKKRRRQNHRRAQQQPLQPARNAAPKSQPETKPDHDSAVRAALPDAVSPNPAPDPPASPSSKPLPPAIRVWRNPAYALFEAGWMPQSITSWMQRVGVTWLAWELTQSNTWVGAVAAADLAPMLVLAPFAGAYADRSNNPMRLLRLAKFLMLAQAIALAWLMYANLMTIELLLALSLVTGIIHPYASAVRQIILAGTVPREDFPPAIALDSALFQASRFIGPALAALMIARWNVASTFIAHIVGSAILLATLYLMRVTPPEPRAKLRGHLLIEIADSIRYTRNNAAIWPLFLMLAVASMLLRPVQDLLPGFASKVFQAGPEGLGWLASSMGVGAMISATLIAFRGRIEGLSTWGISGGLVLVLATLGFTSTNDLTTGIIFAGLTAFGLNTMSTSIQTITQSVVSDGMRGRVMSLYSLIFRGLPAIGALLLGAIADRTGLPATFTVMALMSFCVWALVALQWRTIAAAVRREMA